MSLRDQLFKAGLVDAGKVQKTEAEKRKKGHKLKKDKQLAASEVERRQAEQQRQTAEAEARRERDRELNRQREAQKREREREAMVKQLIDTQARRPGPGETLFNFAEERWIRSLRMSDSEHRQLGRGQLAIVRGDRDFDYRLLPRAAALRLQELAPSRILLLQDEGGDADADFSWDD